MPPVAPLRLLGPAAVAVRLVWRLLVMAEVAAASLLPGLVPPVALPGLLGPVVAVRLVRRLLGMAALAAASLL